VVLARYIQKKIIAENESSLLMICQESKDANFKNSLAYMNYVKPLQIIQKCDLCALKKGTSSTNYILESESEGRGVNPLFIGICLL